MRVFVAGSGGMVGSAICRALRQKNYVTEVITRSHAELDLVNQLAVRRFMQAERPDAVVLAAARVGGIHANNTYPAEFIHQNLAIQTNVINEAHEADVERLLFLGSSCIYPVASSQPMTEDLLLTGVLEPTNEPYAVAKIAGLKMCESYNRQYGRDYRSVMPTNLYGPHDNFHPEDSHVVAALIRRFHEAKTAGDKEVVVWGSGRPKREFMYVDDMASAALFVMELSPSTYRASTKPMLSHINVGTGVEVTISELANTVAKLTGYEGNVKFDTSRPDGAMRKLLDVSHLRRLGWRSRTGLEEGLRLTYEWGLQSKVFTL